MKREKCTFSEASMLFENAQEFHASINVHGIGIWDVKLNILSKSTTSDI